MTQARLPAIPRSEMGTETAVRDEATDADLRERTGRCADVRIGMRLHTTPAPKASLTARHELQKPHSTTPHNTTQHL